MVEILERFEDYYYTAEDCNRENSHGSDRTKTSYRFLSITRMNLKNKNVTLTIFLPKLKNCIFVDVYLKNKSLNKFKKPKSLQRHKAISIIKKALKKNKEKLPRREGHPMSPHMVGLYLTRLRLDENFTEDKAEIFKKAFKGTIPDIFIEECKKARVYLKKYGENKGHDPFKYEAKSI